VVGAETATPAGAAGPSNNAGASWTNLVNGRADLGAQTVEWDIHVYQFNAPISQAYVKIWGPTKQQISQASDFNGASIKVYGGMQAGLPLATAEANGQAGLLLSGQIYQAFGNWQGINQTLEFVVTSDGGATQSAPAPLSFLWLKGQQLSQVIKQTLMLAYPAMPEPSVSISPNLVLSQTEAGVYQTLQQFAAYVNGISRDILGSDYSGIQITNVDGVITVYDETILTVVGPKQILEQDLIGQPTWLDAYTISFSTVMRADLKGNSTIKLPALSGLQAVTSANSQSNARAANTFSGTWTVQYLRHIGNSRAPDAQSWITTVQAVSNTASPAALASTGSSA
jgi:hypothetical protein